MKYPPDSLAAQIGRTVELRFVDGEVVHARLLAIDPDDHEDITCEVVRVIAVGSPPARGGLGRFDEAIAGSKRCTGAATATWCCSRPGRRSIPSDRIHASSACCGG